MKKLFKVLKWTGIVVVVLIIALIAFVQLSWDKKHTAPYPQIVASTDSAVIERGRYLAYGAAHCASCHMPFDKFQEVENGAQLPMMGGWGLDIDGFGRFNAPNLTPDIETGIGKRTDAELARSMRHSITHEGAFMMPFMPFQEMSDEDLTAVISFLRAQEPVKNEVPRSEYHFMGKAVLAFGLLKPQGPKQTPPKSVAIDSTIEYGKYLANNVGNCLFCHTSFDQKTGKQTGQNFAGGGLFMPDNLSEGYGFISPNITPDKSTGVMANWTEELFIARFRAGRLQHGSPMPWGAYSRLNEMDLKALYRYLKSLEPVENKIAQTVFTPEEKIPK